MNVAVVTASRVHHFRAISASFCGHIGRIPFVTAMTDANERM